jgi:LmbE family N-acetylglucosaminyl deacetylase
MKSKTLSNCCYLIVGCLIAVSAIFLSSLTNHWGIIRTKKASAIALPIDLGRLLSGSCRSTDMNIVAHEDDDLLFMNPDILHGIQAGHCVRTIYLTAGDAGRDAVYWSGREQGAQAAYSTMLGSSDPWVRQTVQLSSHEFITVASLQHSSKVTLIFMRLPDGNFDGSGFAPYGSESLDQLEKGTLQTMHSVDGSSTYNLRQLTDAVGEFIRFYKPTEIRTQSAVNSTSAFPDHSDHMAAGRLVQQAHERAGAGRPLKFYVGYPVQDMPANVSGTDFDQKRAAFLGYTRFDLVFCAPGAPCAELPPDYTSYLQRQYQAPN